jgi:hypothetical protein
MYTTNIHAVQHFPFEYIISCADFELFHPIAPQTDPLKAFIEFSCDLALVMLRDVEGACRVWLVYSPDKDFTPKRCRLCHIEVSIESIESIEGSVKLKFKVDIIVRGTRIDAVATGVYDTEDVGEIDVLDTCDWSCCFTEHLLGLLGSTDLLKLDAYVQHPDEPTYETNVEFQRVAR